MTTTANVLGGAAVYLAAFSESSVPMIKMDVYTDGAVAALNAGHNTYADSQANFSDTSAVTGAYNGSHVAVVSLPAAAVTQLDPNAVAGQILARTTGYDTVIVVVEGNSIPFGVAGNDAKEIASTLNSVKTNSSTAENVVIQKSNTVKDLATKTVTSTGTGGATASFVGTVVGVGSSVVGLLVVAALISLFVGRVKASRRSVKVKTRGDEQVYVPATKFSKYLPDQLAVLAKQLDDLGRKHSKINNDHLTPQIAKIINNLQELFNRIHKQSGDGTNNARLAEVEYVDKLKKLNEALGDDYYLDIAAKPDLWDNPQARLTAVDDAVDAVQYQLVENIRQVNASKDLKFQVALDSLMAAKGPNVNDIYTSKIKKKTDPTIA